jgi:putative flippase GtrA
MESQRVAKTVGASPTAKVAAGGVAGAVVTLLITALQRWLHWDVPPEVSAALVTVVSFLVAYLTSPKPGEVVEFDRLP